MKLLLMIAAALLSGHVQAQVYKCTEGGKTVFSDKPCGQDARVVEMKPASGAVGDQSGIDAAARTRAYVEESDRTVKRRMLSQEIGRKEHELKGVQDALDKEMAALRNKKQYAANNLAGATWEASISQEMQAVTASHEGRIKRLQAEIDRLAEERDALR